MNLLKKIIKSAFKPTINKAKGAIGEQKVSAKLNPLLFGKVEHRQINNLVLIDENGKSHQIDHIEIRQNGIFYKGFLQISSAKTRQNSNRPQK